MSLLYYDCDYQEVCPLENIWRSTISSIHNQMNTKRVLLLYEKIPSDCMQIIFDFLKDTKCKRVQGIKKIKNNTFLITDYT